MSLDDTSRPGRPGLDELVPSRYALRVKDRSTVSVVAITGAEANPYRLRNPPLPFSLHRPRNPVPRLEPVGRAARVEAADCER